MNKKHEDIDYNFYCAIKKNPLYTLQLLFSSCGTQILPEFIMITKM